MDKITLTDAIHKLHKITSELKPDENIEQECIQVNTIVENILHLNNTKKQDKKRFYRKLMNVLLDDELVDKYKQVQELLELISPINEILFHTALTTRDEWIIRMFMNYVPITRITPEQLKFFTPIDNSPEEKKRAYQLSLILIEYNYPFGQDDTSMWFYNLMMENKEDVLLYDLF
jgi:hypothetical protein